MTGMTTRIVNLLVACCFLLLPTAFAQTGGEGNPFELIERLNEEPRESPVKHDTAAKAVVEEQAGKTAGNPFEARPEELKAREDSAAKPVAVEEPVIEPDPDNPFEKPKEAAPAVVTPEPEIKIELPKAPEGGTISHFWLGGIFIGIMALLAFFNTVFRSELRDTFRAFTNSNILSLLYREKRDFFQGYFFGFYLFFIINMGVFLFLAGAELNFFKGSGIILAGCILLVGVVIILRHLLLSLIRKIFPFQKELGLYAYVIAIYNQVVGLLIVPFSLALAFSPNEFKTPILYVALAMLAIVYLYRSFRGLVISGKFLAFHKFHFFVYLCTVEAAPAIILVKFINNWGSIV